MTVRPDWLSVRLFARTYPLALALTLTQVGIMGCGASPTPIPETPSPSPQIEGDADKDGFSVEEGDCDDQNPFINPDATDVPYDGFDQDCSGADITDQDGDGFDAVQVQGEDCDDLDPNTYPDAPELGDQKDNDCNGAVDDGVDTVDNDGDGFSEAESDCNDLDPNVAPDADEIPYDGVDQDCDGEDLVDVDGDKFPGGALGTDCNDTNPDIHPGAPEVAYDDIDQDCDGKDEVDVDNDGFSVPEDCDDTSPTTYPGAPEVALDGVDQDCSGADVTDADDDGYAGGIDGPDCDDSDPNINPSREEIPYDDIDQDCDGADLIDFDEDGFVALEAEGDDCDDKNPNTFPGAPEFEDDKDNDCNGLIDDGLDTNDDDQDGFSEAQQDCDDADPTSFPGAEELPYNGVDEDCSGSDLDDVDMDGFRGGPDGLDCNDADKSINPDAAEVPYDGLDQDCTGGDLNDLDYDGYIGTAAGFGDDCNDNDNAVHPNMTEVPYDGVDQDCAGGDLVDVDGDGAASTAVAGGTDCQDTNRAISPSALEVCDGIDNNCDGVVDLDAQDRGTYFHDGDLDSFGDPEALVQTCTREGDLVENNYDCDDANAAINPLASEVCDLVDNNCDYEVDEGVESLFYFDNDTDGFGDASTSTYACSAPAGYVNNSTDCNDASAAVSPAAPEVCNGADEDCDGTADDGVKTTYYMDGDLDGYGRTSPTVEACSAPTGYVANDDDCKDTNDEIYPGAAERCNSVDDNCDGNVDENVVTVYYQDSDNDGYGNPSKSISTCNPQAGYVSDKTDCNDASNSVHPGATETCNGVDDNCNTQVDDGALITYYQDTDGDGYGLTSKTTQACSKPQGYAANGGDCNESSAAINPGASETCNAIDDNCNSQIDEGVKTRYYADSDRDGYGTDASGLDACSAPTSAYVTKGGDCDDTKAAVHPGATETCNTLDDDCDGQTDEGGTNTFYRDLDGDGYGNPSASVQGCFAPTGYVSNNQDCRDNNDTVYPGATEVCNGVDDDCDSQIDENLGSPYYQDADNDTYGNPNVMKMSCQGSPQGYVSNKTDCNDNNAAIYPGATEVVNGVDDNCDGQVDFYTSCKDVITKSPTSASGVYSIDPDGAGTKTPFNVYCDMATAGGGWTLVAIFTNADSKNWGLQSANWINTTTFGDATLPNTNADAKSRAWSELAGDEVLIARPGTAELRSVAGCLGSRTYSTIFNRNSENDADCAWSCGVASSVSPWTGQAGQDSTLRFRCMDTNGGSFSSNGYLISYDDNSMITTKENVTYIDYNFGLGAGYISSEADFDSSTDDAGNISDTTQRLLYLR